MGMLPAVTRRSFLEQATYVALLAGLATRAGAAASGMYISLNSATTRGVSGVDRARLAAKLGFGGVDWDFGAFKTLGVDASKALFAELKIKPAITNLTLGGPFGGDDAAFQAKLPQLADDAAFLAAIGCQRMMTTLSPTSGLPKDEQRKVVQGRLAAISEVLQKSNVRLGIEFLGPLYMHADVTPSPCPARAGGAGRPGGTAPAGAAPAVAGGAPAAAVPPPPIGAAPAAGGRTGGRGPAGPRIPFIWTMSEAVALAKDSGPQIGVVLDVWHWHHSGSTVADILAAGKARVVQVHVSDAKAGPPEEVCDSQRLMPGEGVINLTGFFQALQKIGYEDSISPEPLGRVPMEMSAEEGSKLALDTTTAAMKKAGIL